MCADASSLKIRGVNLGGWLVLEKWIKPSLFAEWDPFDPGSPKDEWTYCKWLGKTECSNRLNDHWASWVTEDTMEELADAGITHIRVPVGWWIMGDIEEDEPYVTGQWRYLIQAVRWADSRNITVWLDLHAAPGSQNGFDNSGRLGNATWDKSQRNVNRTLDAVSAIVDSVLADGVDHAVSGFGLLNEPDQHIDYWLLLSFYNDAYAIIRRALGDRVSIYIGDMFNPKSFNWFWHAGNPIEATNVFLDSHIYACFVDDLKAMTPKQHITQVCRYERAHINQCCWDGWPPQPTELGRFVGEWTAAYDQTPSPELEHAYSRKSRPLTTKRKEFLHQYVVAQIATYEATPEESANYVLPKGTATLDFHGWFFWNFRMETDVYREWDYLRGVREGWIPRLARGRSIADQFGLTCAAIEESAADCTDGIVDPFPPIPGWKGVQCAGNDARYRMLHASFRKERRIILLLLSLLALVFVYAISLCVRRAARGRQNKEPMTRPMRRCINRILGRDAAYDPLLGSSSRSAPKEVQLRPAGGRDLVATGEGPIAAIA